MPSKGVPILSTKASIPKLDAKMMSFVQSSWVYAPLLPTMTCAKTLWARVNAGRKAMACKRVCDQFLNIATVSRGVLIMLLLFLFLYVCVCVCVCLFF